MQRPDHPDFWLLSRLVIDQDKVAEGGTSVDDQLGRIVDGASLAYVARQRAMRAKAQLNILPDTSTVALAAVWLDAFILGAAYQSARSRGVTE